MSDQFEMKRAEPTPEEDGKYFFRTELHEDTGATIAMYDPQGWWLTYLAPGETLRLNGEDYVLPPGIVE